MNEWMNGRFFSAWRSLRKRKIRRRRGACVRRCGRRVLTKGDSWNSRREAAVRLIKWIAYTHRFCNTRAWKNTHRLSEGCTQYLLLLFFPSNTRTRRLLISYYNNQVTFLKLFQKKSVCTPPLLTTIPPRESYDVCWGKITPTTPVRFAGAYYHGKVYLLAFLAQPGHVWDIMP